ncbi:MAG: class I SAM-dependent methyltransferase [Kofleriaceae bacterium]|nr:class I SAM-dependent methyltransferase [Kofleriaceae bacterium]
MLWTLHNRASEAKRPDAFLVDPEAVRIYEAIPYDYMRKFGKPDGTHALRSRIYDDALRPWLRAHPGGTVVELGCGLETQFQRIDDGLVRWLCVDVPDAIDVRERFLPATDRCHHVRASALDLSWLDRVVPSRGVFVSAQGLFMYFTEAEVRGLLVAIVERFPGVELMFDVIPPWFSRRTVAGLDLTEGYRVPPMPWGIKRGELASTLRQWLPSIKRVETRSYGFARGPKKVIQAVFSRIPKLSDIPPAIAHVYT